MGEWHQAWGFRWRSPSDSINDPALERIDDAAAAGGAIGASQGQAQGGAWRDTGYGTQYQGSSLDNATALRESRTGQSLPLQHTNVASAQAVSSGTPWHEASGAFAGVHAGQFWRSPTNSINDPNVEWSPMDPSGGSAWQDSGLGFRYKSPSGTANDPNVVIDPYVPGSAAPKTLSQDEARAIEGLFAPKVTEADPNAPVPSVVEEGAPVQNAGGNGDDGTSGNYDKAYEPYFQQITDGLGVSDPAGTMRFLRMWVQHESPFAAHTWNGFGLTEPTSESSGNFIQSYNSMDAGARVMLQVLTTHGPNDFGRIGDALRRGDYCEAAKGIGRSGWIGGVTDETGAYIPALLRELGC